MPATPFIPPPQCFPIRIGGSAYVTHLSVGGLVLRFSVNGKTFAFEMHNQCGPIPVTPKTEEMLKGDWPKVAWSALDRWCLGGKLVEGDQCVIPEWCRLCGGTGDVPTGETYRRSPVVEQCGRCKGKRIEKPDA